MKKTLLIKIGELFLKGKNKHFFERVLFSNIKQKISKYNCNMFKISNRYVVSDYNEDFETQIINTLINIFGIHSVSPSIMMETNKDTIYEYVKSIKIDEKSFRVTVNRADKQFDISSSEFSAILGGIILDNNKNLVVDLHNPEKTVFVDIRENKSTFIYYNNIMAVNGLPVGTSSGGLLLLSGGIDSPVAGYLMAKRGMPIQAIHFHSYPYTSEQAKQKVVDLANIISNYVGNFKLSVISVTKIQEEIHNKCNEEYMITLLRRFMMRIAETVCKRENLKAIITGESLGQVASQTIESITTSNDVLNEIPILRPLIAYDKDEITKIAVKIGTFDTSIKPFEDCCTVFLPKNPLIKPKLEKVIKEENKLNINELIDEALNNIEEIYIKNY